MLAHLGNYSASQHMYIYLILKTKSCRLVNDCFNKYLLIQILIMSKIKPRLPSVACNLSPKPVK